MASKAMFTNSFTCDWKPNRGRTDIQLSLLSFRLSNIALTSQRTPRWLKSVIQRFHRLFTLTVSGMEIPARTVVGKPLIIHHAQGIVINETSVLGKHVHLRQGVTIGARRSDNDCPKIGDSVQIGAMAAILGAIHIADDSLIGAHAVVLNDVPRTGVVAGNPARLLPPKSSCRKEH